VSLGRQRGISLGLGGLFGAITMVTHDLAAPTAVVHTLSWLTSMNILLGVFSLLPGTPLHGGRVLRGLLWQITICWQELKRPDRNRASCFRPALLPARTCI
jgi:Zn-dependent protease